MGEIADDVCQGLSCSLCGIYFIKEHGYPVLCRYCFTESSAAERANARV